ncbi:MAG: permease-like cell division protein FtsX, partial [Patescibacteria group bacterium]
GEAERLFSALQALPGVASVEYVTREQAYEFERDLHPEWIAGLDRATAESPFRDVLMVELQSAAYRTPLARLLRDPEWMDVVDATAFSRAVEEDAGLLQVRALLGAGRWVLLFSSVLLFLVLVSSLVALVRKRALLHREEVTVGWLSGAQDSGLLLPFAAEAFLLLFIAFALSVLILVLLTLAPPLALLGNLALAEHARGMFPLLGIELLSLPFIAILGAWLGVRPFLRK